MICHIIFILFKNFGAKRFTELRRENYDSNGGGAGIGKLELEERRMQTKVTRRQNRTGAQMRRRPLVMAALKNIAENSEFDNRKYRVSVSI